MRSLTSTLAAAQKQAAATPYLKVEASNRIAGVVRYDWARLYTGTEDDYFHALAIPADGSLVRARITPPPDARKLYCQRVASPGPTSDFTSWVYTGQYNALAVASAALGAEVSIFWINGSREIKRIRSSDNGASWDSPELIDYSPTTAIYGLAAAYKPGGDLAVFFADQTTLNVKRCVSGSWQARTTWDKTTGDLSGVAGIYDADWDLLVTGQDAAGNFKLWSLVYGDDGDVSAGTWSALKELASAPAGGDFQYLRPFLDKPDVHRAFFIEKFTGSEAYSRPFWSHSVTGSRFADSLWREPVPFNLASDYGLAMAHHGDYCWLTSPSGVWRAGLASQSLDLTADVISAREEVTETSGRLTVELRNDEGQYATPGLGSLSALDLGGQLDVSPGYVTPAGQEASSGQSFRIEDYEHAAASGKASLVLHAEDGWATLSAWRARHQFRWNKTSSEASVKDILAFVLARVGLKLEAVSESSVITGFYPDFTINVGNSGQEVVRKLLSFVPDVLFIEGAKGYVVNPLSSDSAVYSYGAAHPITEGRYRRGAWPLDRVQAEGRDGSGGVILADSFAWPEIERQYDRLVQLADANIDTVARAQERGTAYLRQAEIHSGGGAIAVPVNCGQQLYDVIEVTDARAGLAAVKKRVLGLQLVYAPHRAEYTQRLTIGEP